ncbi:vacuolar protein 8 [Cucumis melo var. makuwa]|uniref:Vacuolar protein 8 n=1 Tax=Cucumis melo var. makuwa TaxID=1194695 RepID=A0A5D3BDI8_CUCMM|nr:vacuolar protein 8 [Cucumis melo var. makuwa]
MEKGVNLSREEKIMAVLEISNLKLEKGVNTEGAGKLEQGLSPPSGNDLGFCGGAKWTKLDHNDEAKSDRLRAYSPIAEALIFDGFVDRLLPVLSCGVLGARTAAARAVYKLGFCTKTRKEMGESGFITPLVNMLDGKSVMREKQLLRHCLLYYSTLVIEKNFQKEERGIISAVQLLNPSISNVEKKYPVSLLSSVAISSKCRKQMVAAGAGLYLQKLVEMNVEGLQAIRKPWAW